MIVTTRKHSYFVNDLSTVELGSTVLDLEDNKMYMLLNLAASVESVEELAEAIAAGGQVNIVQDIDAPTGFKVNTDTVIINNKVITNEFIICSILDKNFYVSSESFFQVNYFFLFSHKISSPLKTKNASGVLQGF